MSRYLALRLSAPAAEIETLQFSREERPIEAIAPGEALVAVKAAAINPSDAKAALGKMPQAVWPRTPGRDYAGIVLDGPAAWVGREVWGTSGHGGIVSDGSHAALLRIPAAHLRAKPKRLSFAEAGAVGVPFVTAFEGFRRAGGVRAEDVVLVLGANGKVGQAAVQLAAGAGARVFAAARTTWAAPAHVTLVDAETQDAAALVRDATAGHGADIVFNTVGSPYFDTANTAMAHGARQILISTIKTSVDFDIFRFFRGRHTFLGVDSLALDGAACGEILDALLDGFEDGRFTPFPVRPEDLVSFAQAEEAYRRVFQAERARLVLTPEAG